MKFIDDLLDKIDAYYVGKSQKDRVYSYIMAGFGIAALIYLTTYDLTGNMYKKAQTERSKIVTILKADKNYLRSNSANDIAAIQNSNKSLRSNFTQISQVSDYINFKISELKPMIYNHTAWGTFIDALTQMAKSNRIHMVKISNLFVENKNDFGHVLDLELTFTGSFHDTLRYINALEKTPLVVDIHDMKMSAGVEILTELKIAVWGIHN